MRREIYEIGLTTLDDNSGGHNVEYLHVLAAYSKTVRIAIEQWHVCLG